VTFLVHSKLSFVWKDLILVWGSALEQNEDNREKFKPYIASHCITQHGAASRIMKLRDASNFDYNNPRLPFLSHFQTISLNPLKNSLSSKLKMASTSSSAEFTSLVTLRYHDFRVERLRLLWNLFNSAEQVRIKNDLGKTMSLLTMEVN
jgi:hypothetical protein